MAKKLTLIYFILLLIPGISVADEYDDAIDDLAEDYRDCVDDHGYQLCEGLKLRVRQRTQQLYRDQQRAQVNSFNRKVGDCYSQAQSCTSRCSSDHVGDFAGALQCSTQCLQEQRLCQAN